MQGVQVGTWEREPLSVWADDNLLWFARYMSWYIKDIDRIVNHNWFVPSHFCDVDHLNTCPWSWKLSQLIGPSKVRATRGENLGRPLF